MRKKTLSPKRRRYAFIVQALMRLSVGLTAALVLFLLVYVLAMGVPNITWELLSTSPSYLTERVGILPDILNTVYIVLATLLVVLPLGVGAAIYLTEYASNKKVVAAIEYAAETLSGIPSIIYGLVGMLLFSNNMGSCLLAGALTLVIMNLPTVMRTTQESLKTVPQSYREGAFGLGAGAIGNVVVHAHGERIGLLKHHANLFAQAVYIHGRGKNVLPVVANIAGDLHPGDQVVHTVQCFQKSGFAAAGRADQRGNTVFGDVHADVLQRLVFPIPQAHIRGGDDIAHMRLL